MLRRNLTPLLNAARSFTSSPSLYSSVTLPEALTGFGELCFNKRAMKEYLGADADEIINALEAKQHWTPTLTEKFTAGAHRWAADKGCTHVTHVFQPLSGVIGEKHDIMFKVDDYGNVTSSLKPSNILSSEPDASSFPNGGLRATHEARGNCIWDPQSYLTVGRLGDACTLRVPAIFVGWNGHALDHKTPLLRSEQALQNATLNCFNVIGEKGNTRVDSHCGLEQEFFLIDDAFYSKRPDLLVTGRTLLGRDASRGQDHSDRYFGFQAAKMQDCIYEMEQEFWKLGIPNSTRHREVAPAQYEMAPSFERANQANDNNLIMMEVMKEVARRHDLAVLLHEKPFANLNGSGKHNNWSFGTNIHRSFFRPDNQWFMLTTAAFVRAVHLHGDVLRAAVATAGNDHRLGGHEAPPGIMSIYVGDQVIEMVEKAIKREDYSLDSKGAIQEFFVDYLPSFEKQPTDRNRTSPIAFCGNRFEFRAVGSSVNTAWSTTCLNTIQADSMNYMAQQIAEAKSRGEKDPVGKVISEVLSKHKDVIFNGNGYSEAWVTEAANRGLPNSVDTPDALRHFNSKKNQELFSSLRVLSVPELTARSDVFYQNFYLDIVVELRCLIDLVNLHVLPSAYKQYALLRDCTPGQNRLNSLPNDIDFPRDCASAQNRLNSLVKDIDHLTKRVDYLDKLDEELESLDNDISRAEFIKTEVRPTMKQIRLIADKIEGEVAENLWTLPTYHQMIHIGH